MQQIIIAAVSARNEIGKVDANLAHYSELIAKTKESHPDVDLILFPEMGLAGFEHTERITEFGEPIPGPTTDKACALSREHNVALALGMTETEDGKYYITHFVVTPDGYVGKYRKIYSVQWQMGRFFSGGTEFPVFELKGFRFGFNICYDNRFPLNTQMVVHNGADILLTPYANGTGYTLSDAATAGRSRSWTAREPWIIPAGPSPSRRLENSSSEAHPTPTKRRSSALRFQWKK